MRIPKDRTANKTERSQIGLLRYAQSNSIRIQARTTFDALKSNFPLVSTINLACSVSSL